MLSCVIDLVELKGPNDIGRSRFTESHFKNKCLVGSFPKKTHIQTKLIFQRQSGESAKTKDPQTGPATMKRSVESREAPVVGSSNKIARLSLTASSSRKQSAQQASMPAEETPVPEPTQQNLPGNGSSSDKSKKSNSIFFSWMNATPKTSTAASHNGSPVNGTSQRETPPLLHPQQPPRITREADPPIQAGHCLGIQHGPKQQSPVQPPTRSSQQGSLSQRISNVETARSAEPSLRRGTHLSPKEPPTAQLSGSRQQNSLSQHLRSSQGVVSQTSTKPQQGPAFSVGYRGQMASQVYADFAANSRIAFTPPVRTSTAFRSRQRLSSSSKKGSVTSWNHEKREQSKKQSRAFANRCDNPFSGFKHDPNDAELVLENLSSSNEKLRENNSLIPQQELQALRAVQRGFNRPVKKFRFDDRSRNKRHFRPSARELLASKAAEQEAYAAESSIAPLGREVSPIPPRRLAEAQQQTATPGNYSVVTDYANQQQQLRHPQNQVPMRQYGPPRGFSQHLSVPPEQHCGQIQVSHYCVQQFAGPEQRGNTQHDYQPQISHQGYGGYISQNQNPMIEDHHDHSDRNEFWDPTWNAENFPPEDRPEPQEAAMFQGKGYQFMQGQGSSSYAHPNGHVMQRTTQMPYHQPVHQMVPPLRRRANDESRPQASAAAEVTFERAFLD